MKLSSSPTSAAQRVSCLCFLCPSLSPEDDLFAIFNPTYQVFCVPSFLVPLFCAVRLGLCANTSLHFHTTDHLLTPLIHTLLSPTLSLFQRLRISELREWLAGFASSTRNGRPGGAIQDEAGHSCAWGEQSESEEARPRTKINRSVDHGVIWIIIIRFCIITPSLFDCACVFWWNFSSWTIVCVASGAISRYGHCDLLIWSSGVIFRRPTLIV